MPKGLTGILFAGAVLSVVSGPSTYAETVAFNFNSLSDGANNAAVQTYMNGVLASAPGFGIGKTITVTGARAEQNYTGDNHVVGPVIGGVAKPLTLGNSNGASEAGAPHIPGAADVFITNIGGLNYPNDRIVMQFTGFTPSSVSFDYQIFPYGGCPSASNCPQGTPDFSLWAYNGAYQQIFQTFGVTPGTTNGEYNESRLTDPNGWPREKSPQFIGISGAWNLPANTARLEFRDWPALIGIDNLQINTPPPTVAAVPEPTSVVLLFTVAFVCVYLMRRKLAATRPPALPNR